MLVNIPTQKELEELAIKKREGIGYVSVEGGERGSDRDSGLIARPRVLGVGLRSEEPCGVGKGV